MNLEPRLWGDPRSCIQQQGYAVDHRLIRKRSGRFHLTSHPGKSYRQVHGMGLIRTPSDKQIIQQWMEQGISQKRSRTTNQHGKRVEYMDYYKLPTSGRLFLPREQYGGRTTNKDHLSYHAVWSAVNKLEKAYTKERGTGLTASMSWERIRTHSGRATKITLMMGEGISLAVSMRYARHSSDSIHTHLRYGRLSCAHIYNYLLAERERVAATAAETPAVKRSRNTAVAAELCGTTLKDLVCWAKEGILTAEEFEKAKKNLACLQ